MPQSRWQCLNHVFCQTRGPLPSLSRVMLTFSPFVQNCHGLFSLLWPFFTPVSHLLFVGPREGIQTEAHIPSLKVTYLTNKLKIFLSFHFDNDVLITIWKARFKFRHLGSTPQYSGVWRVGSWPAANPSFSFYTCPCPMSQQPSLTKDMVLISIRKNDRYNSHKQKLFGGSW